VGAVLTGEKGEDKNVIKEGTWEGPHALADLFYTHTASSRSDRSFVHHRWADDKHFPFIFAITDVYLLL
jgi:hypothetical protein